MPTKFRAGVLNDFRKYHAGDHGLNNDQYDHIHHHSTFGLGKDSGVSMPEIIACMAFTVWTLIVHAISVVHSCHGTNFKFLTNNDKSSMV